MWSGLGWDGVSDLLVISWDSQAWRIYFQDNFCTHMSSVTVALASFFLSHGVSSSGTLQVAWVSNKMVVTLFM